MNILGDFVSVIIPTHNRASTIERALQSVFNQTFKAIEIIVVDDASTDNSSEVLEKYADSIRYVKLATNSGGALARNHGAKLATGEFIAFLDSDDEWLPDCLERKVEYMKSLDSDGIFGDFYKCNTKNVLVRRNLMYWDDQQTLADYILSGQGDCRTSTLFFKKDAFLSVLFDENLQKHQDWDLGIRFSNAFSFCIMKEPLTIIHYGGKNRMSKSLDHDASEIFIEKHRNQTSKNSLFRFFFFQTLRTYLSEGKTTNYLHCRQNMLKNRDISAIMNIKTLRLYLFSFLMYWPQLGAKIYKYLY